MPWGRKVGILRGKTGRARRGGPGGERRKGTMEREYIHLENLREHNLKGVCLDIPKRAITVFTGVSGSGKSSLVFDTLGAEAQRQLGERCV